jgi:hypothetical protein
MAMIFLITFAAFGATFRAPLDLDALVATSTSIVYGTVESAQCAADGMTTTYDVAVYGTLSGQRVDSVSIRRPGSACGYPFIYAPGVPLWQIGTDVVVFSPKSDHIIIRGAFTVGPELELEFPRRWFGDHFPQTLDDLLVDLEDLGGIR